MPSIKNSIKGISLVPDQVAQYQIVAKPQPTFYFIGVTTTKSAIMKVFPLWTEELGRSEVAIEGRDLKLNDTVEAYRQAVAEIKYDPNSLGALVTAHKINLYEAAHDLFEYLDPYAQTCGEVSSISKRDGALEGHAKDPISAGLSLDAIIGEDYFGHTGGEILSFGPGGSTTAIALHLINKSNAEDRPRRFVVVGHTARSLERLERTLASQKTDILFQYILNDDPQRNDVLMEQMPPASIIINATGMGKDLPGSPITDRGIFPEKSIAWELNYRGELALMHQARAQSETRQVRVEDGWLYFLHGWTQVIGQVYHQQIASDLFNRLAAIAGEIAR
jgi:shikimate dehydrogenase